MTLREMLARAILADIARQDYDTEVMPDDWDMKVNWLDQDETDFGTVADAALATFRTWLAENGLVVVPVEATEEMHNFGQTTIQAGHDAEYGASATCVYRDMIAAAPAVDGLTQEAGRE